VTVHINQDIVIKVEGLHKKFCRNLKRSMYYGAVDVFRGICGLAADGDRLRQAEFWALDDINFELRRGETLAILGGNGSGKSTLLRLINGIFPPDRGRIAVIGRIGALIALGAGFHPQMTGKENIFLNGAILGMTKKEVIRKFDDITDFADIGDFLEAPVSTYSSGMTVRLGFSIAIHSIPEILLVDEVLAVGDVNFQRKCYEKILNLRNSGVSTIVVSHSLSTVERFCERGLLLHNGKQMYVGDIRECTKKYIDVLDEVNKEKGQDKAQYVGTGNVTFSDIYVYQEDGEKKNSNIEFGKTIVIEFKYKFRNKTDDNNQLRIGIRTYEGHDVQKIIAQECPFIDGRVYENEKIVNLRSEGTAVIKILQPRLFPQTFHLDIAISSMRMDIHEGAILNAAVFRIIEPVTPKMYFEHGNLSITEFDYSIHLI
jgi:ABC-type polysaccharide/polyol phosphate transport system ATPase subunit